MMLMRRFRVSKTNSKFFSTHIISSKAKQIEIPKTSLHEFLWGNLDKWPDKTAAVCFETQRSFTYHQLYKRTLSVAKFFRDELKLNKNDTVGIVLTNKIEFPVALLGAIQTGLKVTTCNPNYTAEEIRRQITDCNARAVVTSNDLLRTVQEAVDDLPVIEVHEGSVSPGCVSFEEISSKKVTSLPHYDVDLNDTVVLPYSSGTTGLPKGVELTHTNLVSNLLQFINPEFGLVRKTEGDKQYTIPGFLPFFHIYGMVIVLLQSLVQGAKLVAMPKFSSNNFIQLLRNYKPDVIYGAPPMVLMAANNPDITKEDLSCVSFIMSGAAPLAASDVDRFRSKTADQVCLLQGYGMTETSPLTLIQTKNLENGIVIGGSGFLITNTQARIISADGTSLGPNQSGELVIKGPQVMKGYHNNPSATKEILQDGWIKTGDIAHYDENEHFYITDRLKELIKVKGFQVAPAELEGVLREHPDVEDAAVVGIPHPVLGEAPKAFVVAKKNIKTTQLEKFVADKVAKHKHLTGGIVFIDAIPKNPSGKILRRELKKLS